MKKTVSSCFRNIVEKGPALLVITLFCGLISVPGVAMLFGKLDQDQKITENRGKAKMPPRPANWPMVKAWPIAYEAWLNDHFAFRGELIRFYGYALRFGLMSSPNPGAVSIGKNEKWLFTNQDQECDNFCGTLILPPGDDAMRDMFFQLMSRAGPPHTLAMLVPDKSSVYGECRRERISAPATAGLRSNRFLESARKAGVATLDLRPVVRAASTYTDTYFLYDTHWDIRGAYASYCALLEQLRVWYPGMPPAQPISDYTIRHDPTWYSDLGRMMGLPEIHRETNVMPEMPPESLTYRKGTGMEGRAVFRGGYREGPVVALYHDSFCLWVAPFLLPHVAELRTIWSKNLVPQDFKGADVLVYAALERLIPMGKDWLRASAALMMSSQSRVPAIFHWQHTGGNDRGEGAQWGLVRTARAGRDRAGWLVFGQYHEWTPGRYEARFRLRGRGPEGAEVARVDVCGNKGQNTVAHRSITGRDLDDGRWREMILPFEILPGAIQPFEPRVYFNGIGELDVDWVDVQPVPNVHVTGGESA